MKKLLLFCLLSGFMSSYAQTSFIRTFGDIYEEIPICIKQIGSSYFMSLNYREKQITQSVWRNTQILKMDRSGKIIDCYTDPIQSEHYSDIRCIYPLNDSELLMIGGWKSDSKSNAQIWIMKMDTALNILWENKYMTNRPFTSKMSITENPQGNILIGAALTTSSPNHQYSVLLFEITKNGDSVRSNYFYGGVPMITDIQSLIYINGNYKAFVKGFHQSITDSPTQILQLDTLLNQLDIRQMPTNQDIYVTAEKMNNNEYYVTGQDYSLESNLDVSITKLDSDENVLSYSSASTPGFYPDYSAWQRCMSISNSSIYTGGSGKDNGDFYFCREDFRKMLMLSNYDSLLNCRWTYFYGSDTACYTMSTMDATSDGGCIIAGMFYTPERPEKMLDVVVIKVDSMGLITGPDKIKGLVKNAVLFPNPGSDYLMVQSGPQIAGAKFTLYNTPGYAVLTTKLESTYQQIDTRSLTSGLYLWQIVYRDKIVDQGKWIKQ